MVKLEQLIQGKIKDVYFCLIKNNGEQTTESCVTLRNVAKQFLYSKIRDKGSERTKKLILRRLQAQLIHTVLMLMRFQI